MGYTNCVVPGCKNKPDKGILFKYWPQNPILAAQWHEYLPHIIPKPHCTAVCENHFEDSMFTDQTKRKLKLSAIPSKPYATNSPLVLQGSIHQGDSSIFPLYFGVQCCATSIAACCYSSVHEPDLWTSKDIDDCVHIGTELHSKSKPSRNQFLLPHEVHNQITTPNGKIISVLANTEAKFVGPIHDVENFGDNFSNALTMFFHNSRYGILTCGEYSFGVIFTKGKYWIFDSHAKNKAGKVDEQGKAVLMKFNSINDIVNYYRSIFNCTSSFSITEIQLENQSVPNQPLGDSNNLPADIAHSYQPLGDSLNLPADIANSHDHLRDSYNLPGHIAQSFQPLGDSLNLPADVAHSHQPPLKRHNSDTIENPPTYAHVVDT